MNAIILMVTLMFSVENVSINGNELTTVRDIQRSQLNRDVENEIITSFNAHYAEVIGNEVSIDFGEFSCHVDLNFEEEENNKVYVSVDTFDAISNCIYENEV